MFHTNSSWHKSQSTVAFERQWYRWVVHTQWAVVSGLMSGWWVLDSFVFKTSAHSLATHWVCTTHLHHCLSNPTVLWLLCQLLLGWNTHKWKFLPTSHFVKERQWCRWVAHTQWVASEWADVLNTKESKTHHPLISPLTTCSLGMYNLTASLSLIDKLGCSQEFPFMGVSSQ